MSQRNGTRPGGSTAALSEAYDTALLDLDGVVYTGGDAVEHAVGALAAARGAGMRLAYVTNNALRPPQAVADHLTELGVPTGADDVITSAQAVARLIAEQLPAGAKVLVIGGEGLRLALRERGLVPVDSADDGPAAVAQGYGGPDMVWRRFWEACAAINAGAPWFASNTDLTIPSPRGIVPGNGAAVEVVRIATGAEPQAAGKPLPPMHRETILRTGARKPLVVGDRLDTDIEGAFNGGVDSLLVLTGVTDARQLLAAEPRHRPTYVDADLRGLLAGQPEVHDAGDGAFRCGRWTASASGDALVLDDGEDGSGHGHGHGHGSGDGDDDGSGHRDDTAGHRDGPGHDDGSGHRDAHDTADHGHGGGDAMDGLRALCAAAWTHAGDGSCDLDPSKALEQLGL